MVFKHSGKDFTPQVLINTTNKPLKKITVFALFQQQVNNLMIAGKIGNAKVYNDTLSQLKHFTQNADVTFAQVDYSFLLRLETYFRSRALQDNAISVRFRTVRALFNNAIAEGYVAKDIYPFDRFKIAERFKTKTRKRAITKEEVKMVEALVLTPGSTPFEAQQYFIFSYYGQGINFVDIAKLKWKQFYENRIFYTRTKTGQQLSFVLSKPAKAIINYFEPLTRKTDESYIFPILNDLFHHTPTQKANRIHKVLTRVNRDLKAIGLSLNINTPLTTYVARHTFATVLKRSGVATAIISEAMGHQTEAITQVYLKSFENSIIDEAMEHLL